MHIFPSFFDTQLFWASLKWLMILGVWGVFAAGTWREDRKIRRILQENMQEHDAVTLLRTLHRRDMQIWLQMSLLLIVVAANDLHRVSALLPSDLFSAASPVSTLRTDTPGQSSPTLAKPLSRGMPFSDITEFNEQNSKQEAYIDWLKERYESWLITYYYLQKCKLAAAEDYDVIRRSLERELDSAHADKTIEDNIMLAAGGSFKEMYANIPCDDSRLPATKSMYDANMQQIRKSMPAPHPGQGSATPKTSNAR